MREITEATSHQESPWAEQEQRQVRGQQQYCSLLPQFIQQLREVMLTQQWTRVLTILDCLTKIPTGAGWATFKASLAALYTEPEKNFILIQDFFKNAYLLGECNVRDVVLEFVLYLISQGKNQEATKAIQKVRKVRRGVMQTEQKKFTRHLIDLLDAYQGLIFYVDWKEALYKKTESSQQSLSLSMSQSFYSMTASQGLSDDAVKGIAQRALLGLEIVQDKPGVWDIFLTKAVEIHNFYGDHDKSRQLLQAYRERNPDNPNSHRYLYQLLQNNKDQFEEASVDDEILSSLKGLVKLDPANPLALTLWKLLTDQSLMTDAAQYMFDLLDYATWKDRVDGWQCLASSLTAGLSRDRPLEERQLFLEGVNHCCSCRKDWWPSYHFTPRSVTLRSSSASSSASVDSLLMAKCITSSILMCPDNSFTQAVRAVLNATSLQDLDDALSNVDLDLVKEAHEADDLLAHKLPPPLQDSASVKKKSKLEGSISDSDSSISSTSSNSDLDDDTDSSLFSVGTTQWLKTNKPHTTEQSEHRKTESRQRLKGREIHTAEKRKSKEPAAISARNSLSSADSSPDASFGTDTQSAKLFTDDDDDFFSSDTFPAITFSDKEKVKSREHDTLSREHDTSSRERDPSPSQEDTAKSGHSDSSLKIEVLQKPSQHGEDSSESERVLSETHTMRDSSDIKFSEDQQSRTVQPSEKSGSVVRSLSEEHGVVESREPAQPEFKSPKTPKKKKKKNKSHKVSAEESQETLFSDKQLMAESSEKDVLGSVVQPSQTVDEFSEMSRRAESEEQKDQRVKSVETSQPELHRSPESLKKKKKKKKAKAHKRSVAEIQVLEAEIASPRSEHSRHKKKKKKRKDERQKRDSEEEGDRNDDKEEDNDSVPQRSSQTASKSAKGSSRRIEIPSMTSGESFEEDFQCSQPDLLRSQTDEVRKSQTEDVSKSQSENILKSKSEIVSKSDVSKSQSENVSKSQLERISKSQPLVSKSHPAFSKSRTDVQISQIDDIPKSQPIVEKSQPVIQKSQPVVQKSQPVVEKSQPVIQKSQPVVQKSQAEEDSSSSSLDMSPTAPTTSQIACTDDDDDFFQDAPLVPVHSRFTPSKTKVGSGQAKLGQSQSPSVSSTGKLKTMDDKSKMEPPVQRKRAHDNDSSDSSEFVPLKRFKMNM